MDYAESIRKEMSSGRYGKYGEHKRLERLRNSKLYKRSSSRPLKTEHEKFFWEKKKPWQNIIHQTREDITEEKENTEIEHIKQFILEKVGRL